MVVMKQNFHIVGQLVLVAVVRLNSNSSIQTLTAKVLHHCKLVLAVNWAWERRNPGAAGTC